MIQDYGFRLYNPSIAKFLSVDPLSRKYPFLTPFQFASNTPIWATDLDGLEANFTNGTYHVQAGQSLSKIEDELGYKRGVLTKLNPQLENPDYIEVGWNINIARRINNTDGSSYLVYPVGTGIRQDPVTEDNFGEYEVTGGDAGLMMYAFQDGVVNGVLRHADIFYYGQAISGLTRVWQALRAVQKAKAAAVAVPKIVDEGSKLIDDVSKLAEQAPVLGKIERVKLFITNLKKAKPASNPKEALTLINKELDAVEDLYSGVPKNPNAVKMPNIDDGRMYGVLDNKYVKILSDGSTRAFTRKNTIIISPDGGIKLYVRDRSAVNQAGRLILEKLGSTQ